MKYYENIASKLDYILIQHSRLIRKRYKLDQKQMSKVIETWSQGGDPDSFREFMDEFGFPNTDGGIHIFETYL